MKRLQFFIIVLISCCCCSEFPPNFRRCNFRLGNFNYCLSSAIQHAITQLTRPLPEFNIPCLDPFRANGRPGRFGNAKTGLQQTYNNFQVLGFTNINSTNATFDPTTRILSINITFNDLFYTFDYELNGRFITIPMNVSSPNSTVTLVRPTFELTFVLENSPRNGTQYFRAVNSTLVMVPEQTIFNYTRIFDDPVLNNAINARINQEGNGTLDYLQGLLPRLWTQYFIVWLNNILRRVPIQNLWGLQYQ